MLIVVRFAFYLISLAFLFAGCIKKRPWLVLAGACIWILTVGTLARTLRDEIKAYRIEGVVKEKAKEEIKMFVAIDEKGKRVVADDYEKGKGSVKCPVCGDDLIFKNGRIKVKHFAHVPGSVCGYGSGETNEHLEVKQYLYRYFKDKGIDVYPEFTKWNDIRPDVAVNLDGRWVGFEVQKSQISIDEIQRRMKKNAGHGIYNIWILPQGIYRKMKGGDTFRLSEQNIYLKNLYYGILYVYGDGEIHAIKCQNAESYYEGHYDCDGYHEGRYVTLRRTFTVTCDKTVDLIRQFEFCVKQGYKGKQAYYPESKIYKLKYNESF